MSTARVLVTGAGGFIGSHVVERFALRGDPVRAALRRPPPARSPLPASVDQVVCELLDPAQVARAMRGVTVVVHCAMGKQRANVQGTRNVLEAAAAAGVDRVVHLSTAEVYGDVAGEIDERTPLRPSRSAYATSKRAAEEACDGARARGLPVHVLRPSIVYGPRSTIWIEHLAACLRSGRWGAFAGYGEGLCNLIYVDDLVDAIVAAVEHGGRGGAHNVNGPERVRWNDFFRRLGAALGLPPLPTISSGRALATVALAQGARPALRRLTGVVTLLGRIGPVRRLGDALAQVPTLEQLTRVFPRDAVYVDAKARAELGYAPRIGVDDGVRRSVEWLRETRNHGETI